MNLFCLSAAISRDSGGREKMFSELPIRRLKPIEMPAELFEKLVNVQRA
jgi:hypothetical protein